MHRKVQGGRPYLSFVEIIERSALVLRRPHYIYLRDSSGAQKRLDHGKLFMSVLTGAVSLRREIWDTKKTTRSWTIIHVCLDGAVSLRREKNVTLHEFTIFNGLDHTADLLECQESCRNLRFWRNPTACLHKGRRTHSYREKQGHRCTYPVHIFSSDRLLLHDHEFAIISQSIIDVLGHNPELGY